jgi:ABC-type glycerol-3-phosphate transport system permease component
VALSGASADRIAFEQACPGDAGGISLLLFGTITCIFGGYSQNRYDTLSLGIANMEMRQGMVVWGSQMAASVLATLPVILLVVLMQRQFLRGLTTGAFKA